VLVAALLIFAGVWLGGPRHGRCRLRTAQRGLAKRPRRVPLVGAVADFRVRAAVCALGSALAGEALAGPYAGALGGLGGVALAWWLGRLESPEAARTREQIAHDLPLAIDLLSACVAVGRPTDSALEVVSVAVGGPLADRFDGVRARLALGADPGGEWARLGAEAQLAPLARTMARALESGAPIVSGLGRLAEDTRRERRTDLQLRARSVGVKAAGPLALCFLPAFMLIGVVPTVAGAFSRLLW
jgi:Flp pilus assembly protein TadB